MIDQDDRLSIDEFKAMNEVNVENDKMNKIFGGLAAPGNTLDTTTVTPSGSSNDGEDKWANDAGGVSPQQL